jgi:hypothetical protein
MSEHPAVAYLLAAHERAEGQARAATPGPWFAQRHDWGDDDFAADIGTEAAASGAWWGSANVVGHGYEGGGVVEIADADFIAANHPGTVLARVAAEREILAEHNLDEGRYCRRCAKWLDLPISQQVEPDDAVDWPCRTVLGLAKAWGWEAEG